MTFLESFVKFPRINQINFRLTYCQFKFISGSVKKNIYLYLPGTSLASMYVFKVFKQVIIEDSMYVSGLKENVPDSVLMDLAYINGWDIDFIHDVRSGDSFSLIYEEIIINGEKAIDGDILISEFNNRDKQFIAVRFDLCILSASEVHSTLLFVRLRQLCMP